MVNVELLGRLGGLAQHRRWIIGLWVGRRCRRLHAALVGAEGRALAARCQVFAYRREIVPRDVRRLYCKLRLQRRQAADAALLAAQLAECQAALLDNLAAQIAPVWSHVLAVAVDDPGLWSHAGELTACIPLCDAARLAELCGQNVIDGFALKDLAQDGRGRPLLPLAYWVMLHDTRRSRAVVEWGRTIRVTYLPASHHDSAAARVRSLCLRAPRIGGDDRNEDSFAAIARTLVQHAWPDGAVDEWLLDCPEKQAASLHSALAAQMAPARVVDTARLNIPPGALRSAGVAVLGLLNLDQVPANLPALSGARTPRVLGRITPGALASWHRLVRELASARPSVMTLRSAI